MKYFYHHYCCERYPDLFFKDIKKYKLKLHHIKIVDGKIYFDVFCLYHHLVLKRIPYVSLVLYGKCYEDYVMIKNPFFIISIIFIILFYSMMNQFIFKINYIGKYELQAKLNEEISLPLLKRDLNSLENELKDKFDLTWIEIEPQGSMVNIYYKCMQLNLPVISNNQILVASEDGAIAYYELKYGFKCFKVNDLVKKGDILVSNQGLNHLNQTIDSKVEGRVFAYVKRRIIISFEDSGPKSLGFFKALLKARNEVSQDFLIDDKIISENILHFAYELGKIDLEVDYTLLKDIAINEGI